MKEEQESGAPDEAKEPARDESAEPDEEARAEAEERRTERLTHLLAQQWAQLRAERRHEEPPGFRTGPSNFSRAQVPWGLDLAAAWSWRLIVIAVATLALAWTLRFFAVITLPLVIALLISALAAPMVRGLATAGVPRSLSAGATVVLGLATLIGLLTFVGNQVAQGASDLADQVVKGLGEIRVWLRDGPIDASDSQINDWIKNAQDAIKTRSQDIEFGQVTEVGTALGHVVAGLFIVLFATFFFLADGHRIWSWVVRFFPRAAREAVDSSGRVAWVSLTQFVRATVIVALVDAVGIMIGALVLGVPLVAPIGVLVFLGAFVPMVGAAVAGLVATLVALVTVGPFKALLMLGVVIAVQQIEGHVLQPLVMGRFVSVHPLGVIVAIGCGVIVAGIAGALVAVPLAAVANAVVTHLGRLADPVYEQRVEAIIEDPSP
ncbi:AI-2E family transporter [Nocardioides sp.]|uniref:AI-2E family transporter n=1 Tax=Nocardioides sp. TaxID=35761 RepID=UPI002BBF80C1|nr:AI-2E family transporter [Nocardioides sp.]HSX67294.1 AI-2E family transporter [Nocardioides sp.]